MTGGTSRRFVRGSGSMRGVTETRTTKKVGLVCVKEPGDVLLFPRTGFIPD